MQDQLVLRSGDYVPVRTLTVHNLAPIDERPVTFEPEMLRAGRRTSTVQVVAGRGGMPSLAGRVVFGRGGGSPTFSDDMAADVPDPDAWLRCWRPQCGSRRSLTVRR